MTDEQTTINTGGGASTNDVSTGGGDFVGRDKNINLILAGWSWDRVIEQLLASKDTQGISPPQQAQWQAWNWQEAAAKYHQSLVELYSTIRVLGKSSPVSLEGVFTDVYVLDEVTARLRYDVRKLREQPIERMDNLRLPHGGQRRVAGLEQVKQGKNLFILGKPGAGKTTFLKYITLQAAKGEFKKTPIFVSLHEWAQWTTSHEKTLFGFLVHQFALCNIPAARPFIRQLLQSGQAIVLFDGLDEVRQASQQRADLTRLLNNFAKQYRQCQCLITCRIAANEHLFANFQDVEVADFDDAQVKSYAQKWFGQTKAKYKAFITDLEKAENKGILELCSIPLLLSMLCLAFDDTMQFPPQRAELYERALDVLLNKWDSSRSIQRDEIYRGLSPKRKQQLFAHIAAPTFEKGEYFLEKHKLAERIVDYLRKVPGAPAPEDIDGKAVLKAIEAQHSIFVERAQDVYSFSHLTFQEYFTAKYIVENEARGTTNALIRHHLTDNRWREIFLLSVSLLANADDFMATLKQKMADIIALDTILPRLIGWAERKAADASVPDEQRFIVRLAYLILTFARSRARYFASANDFTNALARALNLALQLADSFDPDRSYTLGFAHALTLDLTFAFDFDLTCTSTWELAHEYGIDVGIDFGLLYAFHMAAVFTQAVLFSPLHNLISDYGAYWQGIFEVCQGADLPSLLQKLDKSKPPEPNASQSEWHEFAASVENMMQTERNLCLDWELGNKQVRLLNNWLSAHELLGQCLNLAIVSDRRAIERDLFLPPKTTTN